MDIAIVTIVGALAATVLGFFLSLTPTWLNTRKERKSHTLAIQYEINRCCEIAAAMKKESIKSPLYRLPSSTYTVSFPILLRLGCKKLDMEKVSELYNEVETLNRGLDLCAAQEAAINNIAGHVAEILQNKLEKYQLRNLKKADNIKAIYAKIKLPQPKICCKLFFCCHSKT